MDIIHIASEVFPFSKTGGLADVAYALPKAQSKAGSKVKILTPYYSSIPKDFKITPTGFKTLTNTKKGNFEYEIYKSNISDVEIYFFSNDYLFNRNGLYTENGLDYPDNYLRFGSFCMACLNFIDQFEYYSDIIHVHDWQTSFTPVLLKTAYGFISSKVVLTIHNMAFQGIFDHSIVDVLNLPTYLYNIEMLEFYGFVNILKGGIVFSDYFTTVSPAYAEEIKREQYGCALEGVVRKYEHRLKGVLNGIDYDIWNPVTDKHLYKKYNIKNLNNKNLNKIAFCENNNLDSNKPLFIFVSRFTEQKGADLIIEVLEQFSFENATFAIIGDGNPKIAERFKKLAKVRKNIFLYVGFNENLAHILYAAADFLLMPSRFEPCGLSQLIAMRYGTIPIVTRTGGLKDTVKDIDKKGYGLCIDLPSINILYNVIERGVNLYGDNMLRSNIIVKCMNQDFSWAKSAEEYLNIYEGVT